MYNTKNILEQIGWYRNAEVTSHDRLTDLFNGMMEYFRTKEQTNRFNRDIFVGFYPINPEASFGNVIKRAHRFIEPTQQSIHKAYIGYCTFLRSQEAQQLSSNVHRFINNDLEDELIDNFIIKTYGQVF